MLLKRKSIGAACKAEPVFRALELQSSISSRVKPTRENLPDRGWTSMVLCLLPCQSPRGESDALEGSYMSIESGRKRHYYQIGEHVKQIGKLRTSSAASGHPHMVR